TGPKDLPIPAIDIYGVAINNLSARNIVLLPDGYVYQVSVQVILLAGEDTSLASSSGIIQFY
ncbi:hypothetical protein ACMWQW_29265, partial [Escherichia coli]